MESPTSAHHYRAGHGWFGRRASATGELPELDTASADVSLPDSGGADVAVSDPGVADLPPEDVTADAAEVAGQDAGAVDAVGDAAEVAVQDAGLEVASADAADGSAPGADALADLDTGDAAGVLDSAMAGDGAADAPLDGAIDAGAPAQPGLALSELGQCDAGDAAWVIRATQMLLGRKPYGTMEVNALADLVKATSRGQVAKAMMATPEFSERWLRWLLDEMQVHRKGRRNHKQCFRLGLLPSVDASLATFVRDSEPETASFATPFNMRDLLQSSLILDDVTPAYRAYLFAMLARPTSSCLNLTKLQLDLVLRQNFAQTFNKTYLHRDTGCMGCHNAEYAVTNKDDPKLDHHWPLPGLVEKALFGSSGGPKDNEAQSTFRYYGVATGAFCPPEMCSSVIGTGVQPWNIAADCGTFTASDKIALDPAEVEGYFIKPLGKTGSVWDLQGKLAAGLAQLRTTGTVAIDAKTNDIAGDQAVAYLLAARISHQVWLEMVGRPLTVNHGFARNADQNSILQSLTTHYIANKLSFRALVAKVALHPLFNQVAPSAGCVAQARYYMPAVHEPFTSDYPVPDERLNSAGDALHRIASRLLVHMVSVALDWPATAEFPTRSEGPLQAALGMRLTDEQPGVVGIDFPVMVAFEANSGAGNAPPSAVPQQWGSMASASNNSCKSRCNDDDADMTCWCDLKCVAAGDCCPDYKKYCQAFNNTQAPPQPPDWIAQLLAAANQAGPPTGSPLLLDLVVAAKDRLLQEPDIGVAEGQAIASFFGAPSLQVGIGSQSDFPAKFRVFCGTLLKTPQFSLLGIGALPQQTKPALVLPGHDYLARCSQWAPLVAAGLPIKLSCTAAAVSVASP